MATVITFKGTNAKDCREGIAEYFATYDDVAECSSTDDQTQFIEQLGDDGILLVLDEGKEEG